MHKYNLLITLFLITFSLSINASSELSNQDLIDLTKKYPYLSRIYGDYGINRVPVMEVVIDYRKEYRKVLEAEIKFKQEAEARVTADKAAAELKAKQEADAKAAAELKAKQEADSKAAAELKAKQEIETKAAAKVAATKKTTITCVKGKLTKKVTAVKPVCPKGYKKK
jgi:regulator of protease activity HflC (stomatin/prohibitin superfamily)